MKYSNKCQNIFLKLMTVATNLIGLMPIMWNAETGSDVMKPITAPMIGEIITSTIHVLYVTPVFFSIMKESALKKCKMNYPAASIGVYKIY